MNNINFQELFCLMYKNDFRNLDSKIYKEDAISIFFPQVIMGEAMQLSATLKEIFLK